ncbi:hypothetical protein REPUB_Repub14bG0150300 [Reevesia pubescens]
MAGIEVSRCLLFSKSLTSLQCRRGIVAATINAPRVLEGPESLTKLSSTGLVEELGRITGYPLATTTLLEPDFILTRKPRIIRDIN